jgi:lysozyme
MEEILTADCRVFLRGLLASFVALPLTAFAITVCPGPDVVQGVDVSSFNGAIDWSQVAASGRKFAIARTSDGLSFVDPLFDVNYQGIKAAGMVRGSYHFFEPSQDPVAQAQLVLSILSKYGPLGPGDLVPMLDVEVIGGASQAAVVAGIEAWVAAIRQATGRSPIVYAGAGFWNSLGDPSQASAGTNLWVANWAVTCPDVPSGWNNWLFWQYSDHEFVPGIGLPVAVDIFNGASVTDNVPPAGNQTAPTIAITSPASQGAYLVNQFVSAGFSCAESGSTSPACVGTNDGSPIVNGDPINTATTGVHLMSVSATDSNGLKSAAQVSYNVRFGISVLYDQTQPRQSGSTLPVKVALTDVNQANDSSPGIQLVATRLDSNLMPGVHVALNQSFRYDQGVGPSGGYILNLRTSGLEAGPYVLSFVAGSDPAPYQVQFVVKSK